MMTKEETPGESHNYGAFFKSSLSLTSELPTEWSGAKQLSDRPGHDLSDPDLIRRVNENATDFHNALSTGQFQESDKNPVTGRKQRKPKKRNPDQDPVPPTQSSNPVDL